MSFYRIQSTDIDPAALLTPGQQSHHWGMNDDNIRDGVSVCGSIEALANYAATTGLDLTGDRVIVEMKGHYSDDKPCDADLGEYLIHPYEVLSVAGIETVTEFWDTYNPAVEAIWGV